ncbi:MAG: CHAT domain-containing protein [Phormidesmis sp. RL_2_1]|nr:CHAT domain-containing protein [Phormidesmis sp. RL_2_1]
MRTAVIQEFEISITAVGNDQYLVRTETVAKGVQLAEEKVHWPVTQWLEQTKALMHDPLLGLLQGQPRHTLQQSRMGQSEQQQQPPLSDIDATTLVHLGQALHNQLFQGQLHDSWITAQGVAQNRQALLRLRIGMKDNRLQQLPWEALHAGTRPLATGTDVIFSRYILDRRQGHSGQLKISEPSQGLRILMVIASPDDQERLELKQEAYHLQGELHPEKADTHNNNTVLDVQLKILEQPGRAELTQELDRGNYQVLHYAGHSNLGNAGGDLYLVSRQTGLTERLSGEDLAGLLVNNGIKLAVFNSCRGGYSASTEQGWQARNLAQALVNRGVPAVIAMTERIPDHVAITFTQLLYRNLKKGQAIDLSLNRTRQGLISAYGSHQFYWALPTLYMQPAFDGYLVQVAGDRSHPMENPRALDAANDPFGGMFSEPGLAEIDLPAPRAEIPVGAVGAVGVIGSGALLTYPDQPDQPDQASNRTTITDSPTNPTQADAIGVNAVNNLVNNHDVQTTTTVVKENSTPLISVETAVHLPEAIETTTGFYGEQGMAPNATNLSQSPQPPQVQAPSSAPSEILVGERLNRSHTLHTKLLTMPGLASMALIVILGITTVSWLQRSRQPAIADAPLVLNAAGLPAQIEVAFNQNELDVAASAIKALIDQGQFSAAITALKSANPTQQNDVIVSFLRGRAQWGLTKQGDSNFSPDDARRSWLASLKNEPDWMEISMALGFAQYAVGKEEEALAAWERAIALAKKQPNANMYFSEQPVSQYILNAYAGLAMVSLSMAKIEANADERNRLLAQASAAYLKVIDEAPTEFNANSLGDNWLWLGSAIADWDKAKAELSQTL